MKEKRRLIILGIVAVLFMGVICLLLYEPMMYMLSSMETWKESMKDHVVLSVVGIILVMVLQVVFVFLPGEVIEVMAGYLFGSFWGMILCLIGAAIGSSFIYLIIKKFGLRFIDKSIGIKKLEEVHFLKDAHNLNTLLFVVFFIPGTPKDIITYFIPFTNMKLSSFLFISSLGRIPSVITSTTCGNAISMDQYMFGAIVFGVTALVSLGGLYIYRHKITTSKKTANL